MAHVAQWTATGPATVVVKRQTAAPAVTTAITHLPFQPRAVRHGARHALSTAPAVRAHGCCRLARLARPRLCYYRVGGCARRIRLIYRCGSTLTATGVTELELELEETAGSSTLFPTGTTSFGVAATTPSTFSTGADL